MKRTAHYKSKGHEFDFPTIESYLGSALRPIQPRATFVNGLKSKLTTEALTRKVGLSTLQYLLIILVGISSTILIILSGTRAIVGVLGALGLLRLASSQQKEKNQVSVSPAR